MKRYFFLMALLLIQKLNLLATHNRSGELILKNKGNLEYEVIVTTYTNPDSDIKRQELTVFFSDNTSIDTRLAQSISVTTTPPRINKNIYKANKKFKNIGAYKAYMTDPNRNQGIINLGGVISVDLPFHIESEIVIGPTVQSSSPDLKYPPIDEACLGQSWEHNPGASSIDGDQFKYELVPVKQGFGQVASSYYTPNGMSINASGTVHWDAPKKAGEYNIAIKISQYEGSRYKGFVVRDMQINVIQCTNLPAPTLVLEEDRFCKWIDGSPLNHTIKVGLQNGLTARLDVNGLPMELPVDEKAKLILKNNTADLLTYEWSWNPKIKHLIGDNYELFMRAKYNIASSPSYKTFKVKLLPKPPVLKEIGLFEGKIKLEWTFPYEDKNNLRYYKIYKKNDSSFFEQDMKKCEITSAESLNYVEIKKNIDKEKLIFWDEEISPNQNICYRIVPFFQSGSGVMSNELCFKADPDFFPRPIEASFVNPEEKEIKLSWENPKKVNIEGPYFYKLKFLDQIIYTSTSSDDLNGLTTSTIQKIEEKIQGTYFSVELWTEKENKIIVKSENFNTILAKGNGGNKKIKLNWLEENIPWENNFYRIYKKNSAGHFELLATTYEKFYIDQGLENGEFYTYYLQTQGDYPFKSGIFNNSNAITIQAIDTLPPPAPTLFLDKVDCENFANSLRWTIPSDVQELTEDIEFYNIYYSKNKKNEKKLLQSVSKDQMIFLHNSLSLAGCYQVEAVDESGNKSLWSNTVCAENCYRFSLPNIFTPDGNGKNDVFAPMENAFVEKIALKIYDRNGKTVFETTKPNFTWDGRHFITQQLLGNGVFFYNCEVYFQSLDGLLKKTINGTITLIREF